MVFFEPQTTMPQTWPKAALTRHLRLQWLNALASICLAIWSPARAEEVRVAVASNFAAPLKALTERFESETGHKLLLSSGATGKLYAQIRSGAPFDIFLSADQAAAAKLEQEGAAVSGSRFTYATGKLVLWSAQPGLVDAQGIVLKTGNFKHLAIASAKLAPYGIAAEQTLTKLGLLQALTSRLVQGESIGQTYSFVASGNAELGFVGLSQLVEPSRPDKGSAWIVPSHLYNPLHQDAVLLKPGRNKAAAKALLTFLKTPHSKTVLRSFGYETE